MALTGFLGWGNKEPVETTPPARQERKKCWESRDAYYSCLDAAGILVPGEEGKTCSAELRPFEQNCAKSWIDYFNQRRVLAERQKESLAMANAQHAESRQKGTSR